MNSADQKSKYTLLGLVLICFTGLVMLLLMSGAGRAQSDSNRLVAVGVEATQLQWMNSFDKIQRVVGRVESAQRANTGFELGGVVANVWVDDGDTISAGQVIAELDTELLESELMQAQAAVERAQAQTKLAQSSLLRVQDLVAKRVESQQRLDEAQQSLDAANATVKETLARVNTIKVNLNKAKLRAPFDGQVLTRHIDKGTVVAQGQAVYELIATGDNDVRMPMPANLIEHVNLGEEYVLRSDNRDFQATLKSIGKQRRLATRTIDAVFELGTDNPNILPGDLMTLDVKITVPESGAWVPLAALSHGVRGLWNVYSVDADSVSQVTPRAVEVLYSDGQFAFIRGAINADMLVVVSGTHRLAPGQEVAVTVVTDNDTAERQ
ncbi:efflux RND transporter periplasmic adaptor subunit [Alteromonas sp. ASW11-36]|uniref:Efflux RND transporter periplasmic adaptor subunit n=1 Tax=Alteromonas arenosi TaxID=3055817 RepID=A0ABT7T0B5_9ALTE|nr:efflux RND transporter periplasmic adaptor subunit [Alteromonas sp. ASW11-36]MDM7861239.1 efflux RND transporter periplasmic adaptor subunit [Alteromonas sp. ASW11-36]